MRLFFTILYLLNKNTIFCIALKSKKFNFYLLIVIYFIQLLIAMFLNFKIWHDPSHSAREAIPIIINLDFFLIIFYQGLLLQTKFMDKITKSMNIQNPMRIGLDMLPKSNNILINYAIITIIEIFFIWIIL